MCSHNYGVGRLELMITRDYLRKNEYFSSTDKQKSTRNYTSFSSPSKFTLHNSNNLNEPLNSVSQDLTFKGSPINGKKIISITDAIAKFAKDFGKEASEHFKKRINDLAKLKDSGVKINGDEISFKEQSNGQKIKEIILYPILEMPLDIAEGTLKLLKKIPGMKDSKGINNLLETKALKTRREAIQQTSDAAAIQKYFEMATENGKTFEEGHNRLNPLVSNYNSTHERALTRLVTGAIPAFTLGNDAHNLYMYMNDDKETAKKEKKRRFNQEMARVAITAAATFGILSFFAKKSNASETTTTLLISGVVLVSEIVGRMMVGTPVLPVSEESAKKYAAKRGKIDLKNKKADKKSKDAFKGAEGKEQSAENSKPPEKGILTLANVLKVVGGLVAFGFGVEQANKLKAVKDVLEPIKNGYSKFLKEDFTISRKDFDGMTAKLEEKGFDKIAKKYREMVKDQTGDTLKIGSSTRTVRDLLVHQILTFPIRFVWGTMMLPYKKIVKPLYNMAAKLVKPAEKEVKKAKTPEEIKKKEMEMLQNSIKFLKKIDGAADYKEQINNSLLAGFDNVTKSSYSNADLSTVTKVTSSGVTSGFLIADNYNNVMIDSQGQDKDLADQKAKERTIQRAVRIIYGAFLIKLFNDIFKTPYNSSLLGAQAVNIGNTTLTESLERTSVGLPIFESTREEIIAKEQKNLNAKGIKGGYYRTMAKLTGKKSLSSRATKKETEKVKKN